MISSRRSPTRPAVWVGALVAGTLLAAASPGVAWSATAEESPVTWSTSPADADGPDGRSFVELELDPGATVTEHVAVRNLSEVEATFALTAADGYYTDKGRFNMLPASERSVDAGTWVAIDPEVTLAPGETRIVPYTITVPENATPGDHAAGVAASVRSTSTGADGTAVGVDSRVGFRVSTRVTGELAPALTVGGVRGEYVPSWNLFAPGRAVIGYTVTNAGNTALTVSDSLSGATTDRGSILPGESREITIEQIDAWPLGLLFFDLEVAGSVPGDTLVASPFTETITLWAIPWLYLLSALGVALILLAIFTGRRRNKRRLERLLQEAREEGRRDITEAVPTP